MRQHRSRQRNPSPSRTGPQVRRTRHRARPACPTRPRPRAFGTTLLRDDRGKHLGFNAVIEVDGDTASVTSDVVKLRAAEPGSGAAFVVQTAGRNIDSLVRTKDGWRVASRRTDLLGF